jgi:hypothetical protein
LDCITAITTGPQLLAIARVRVFVPLHVIRPQGRRHFPRLDRAFMHERHRPEATPASSSREGRRHLPLAITVTWSSGSCCPPSTSWQLPLGATGASAARATGQIRRRGTRTILGSTAPRLQPPRSMSFVYLDCPAASQDSPLDLFALSPVAAHSAVLRCWGRGM